ncbi:(2Fe-2S)-binding protein [Sulfitobacter sp. M62]|uniref:2Fe-2S iron-sulfur cluster-binding protein n=1 Tax=Sulfitobacter sp. M62 TaxID=2731173 RepID=UPI0023E1AD6D|nr:2Fe-2S iron-sulfur cluster-binding protein [Sulfitobacter sp. M62]MDF3542028.1 (2Fe-2S)-binding protein [Sulfitobacter sp. M62]
MTKLVFIEPSGMRREIEVTSGQSVMQVATTAGVAGIDAECGGSCMCATCHCLVVEAPVSLPKMETDEADTLEFTAEEMHDNSRLTCQLAVTEDLGGTVFKVIGR